MGRKIGILTILGLLLLFFSGFVYFYSFSDSFFPQDIVTGIVGAAGIIVGCLCIVIDFRRVKRKDIINEIRADLSDYGNVVIIMFFAIVVAVIIFSTRTYFGFILGGIVCLTIIVPVAVIGLGIFLIFVRILPGKSLTRKKVTVFFVILAVALTLLPIFFVWPSISPTYMGRQPIQQLQLSSDGNFLLSISGGGQLASEKKGEIKRMYDTIVWNTSSGKPLWNKTTTSYSDVKMSPNGAYVKDPVNQSIISTISRETCSYTWNLYDWSADGNFFLIADGGTIDLLRTANYSIKQRIFLNGTIQNIAFSSDGSKIAVELRNQQNTSLILVDVSSMNTTLLYDFSNYSFFEIRNLVWSTQENRLQLIENDYTKNTSVHHFNLIIWNISNNNVNLSFKNNLDDLENYFSDAIFSKYITTDWKQQSQLKLYDLHGLENVFQTKNYVSRVAISSEGNVIAYSNNGNINVINATTGKTINTLYPPQYEFVRIMPGFELIIFIVALAFILFFIRLRRKKVNST